jgi:hypothetical protein
VFYDSVKIDESKGERWFCNAEEAEAAGWERARYGGRPPSTEKDASDTVADSAAAAEKEEGGPSTDAEVEDEAAAEAADEEFGVRR